MLKNHLRMYCTKSLDTDLIFKPSNKILFGDPIPLTMFTPKYPNTKSVSKLVFSSPSLV